MVIPLMNGNSEKITDDKFLLMNFIKNTSRRNIVQIKLKKYLRKIVNC